MGGASVEIHRGPRAAEAALLGELGRIAAEVRSAARPGVASAGGLAGLLARPVRVVVPSRSLREHLAARLVRALPGGGAAGVVVQTLRGVAFEILRSAGEPLRGGHVLFPIVVRQLAREEPALRAGLEDLEDGYGAAAASVSDLLDAGYEPALADALDECLAALPGAARVERARALVRVATRTAERLAGYGLEHRAGLFRRARLALEERPERLPTRALFVHGYADATGVQLELLRAMAALADARVLVDQPADLADPERADSGALFTRRLIEGLAPGAVCVAEPAEVQAPPPAHIELFRASGAQAEVREVAERIRRLLDEGGVEPEAIGVVARDLAGYRLALPVHFERLGIPFSGGEGSLGPAGRRLRALLDLLRDGEESAADRWLDATDVFEAERLRDLRLALHGIGLGRVRDVASADVAALAGERGYRLPVRRGLAAPAAGESTAEAPDEDGAEGEPRAPAAGPARALSRRLPLETLEGARARAARLAAALAALRASRSLGELLAGLRALASGELDWKPETSGAAELHAGLAQLEEELGAELPLCFAEGRLLLERALRDAGRGLLGGEGGGVQVLSVVEARARSFGALFVLGMNRDLFPRTISEDPLLRDTERQALESVLPDIPIKRRGFAEERYLFAQLCAAAGRVTLSFQAVSDDGKERPASPLLEPLLRGRSDRELPLAPGLYDPRDPAALRPAHEHAVRVALAGDRARLAEVLAVAFAAGTASADPGRRARARVAALAELDSIDPRDLGPFFGFVGALADAGDPRRASLYVTRLEGLARCGWQAFLERVLRIEPVPDALEALPRVDPLLLGQVLHGVLEGIVARAGAPAGRPLAEALAAGSREVPWPPEAELAELLRAESERAARERGIALAGFSRVLARRVRPYLERVRELEWPDGVRSGVLGAELEGEVRVPGAAGAERTLLFRADRADGGPGALSLTDYKAGKPFSDAADCGRRSEALRARIAQGALLQAAAYARADARGASGRYLYARPALDPGRAVCTVEAGDEAARAHFEAAVLALSEAWERGSLAPRLLKPDLSDGPDACKWCAVSAACAQGDSGARRRLARWLERHGPEPGALASAAERALLRAWQLGREGGG
jgi:hypothetical protein